MVASLKGAIARMLMMSIGVALWPSGPACASPTDPHELDTTRWPVEGSVSLMMLPPFSVSVGGSGASNNGAQLGGELELGPRGGFWSVGGARATNGPEESVTTLYGRAKLRLGNDHTLSLLSGWNNNVEGPKACFSTSSCNAAPETPYGLLVGASWAYRNDHLWLSVTPQYTFPLYGDRGDSGWFRSMVPWAELGWRATPNFGLALRASYVPLALSFGF